MGKKGKKIFVNLLSFSRVLGSILIPFVFNSVNINVLVIIVISFFITDTLDGFLARKWEVQTYGGRLLDPLGDKLLAISCILSLINVNKYLLIALILEILITIINVYRAFVGEKVKSSLIGKVKMWPLSVTLVLAIMYTVKSNLFGLVVTKNTLDCFAYITLGLEIITALDYIRIGFNTKKHKKKIVLKPFKEILIRLFDEEAYKEDKKKPLIEILSK